jgi:dethiobiotin synthase
MSKGIFITGTDTNVGKTLISTWLALHTKASYWKPIQTGMKEGSDRATVAQCIGYNQTLPEVYALQEPLSPHAAAEQEGLTIDLSLIHPPTQGSWIIEGAGGVFVPINAHNLMIDLMEKLQYPVLIVARNQLGTINHTLLTLEALRSRSLHVLGVILNQGRENSIHKKAIEFYGKTKVLFQFPDITEVSEEILTLIPLSKELQGLG